MVSQDRIEQLRDLAEQNFLKGTPVARLAELIADELEQQRLRLDGVDSETRARFKDAGLEIQ